MIYVTSDIHGNFARYQALLEKISLTEKDALVILGDVVDRGEHGIELLLDIMQRENIFMLFGNHEQMALACLKTLGQEITEESIANFDTATTDLLAQWLYQSGGQTTLDGFMKLSKRQKRDVITFLEGLPLNVELEICQQKYLLVHAGLQNFHPDKAVDDYTEDEFLWERADYSKIYFEDTILVTGHTPTAYISDNPNPNSIYHSNNHLAVDCGCGFSTGRLGCICLNTTQEFYVD